MGQSTDSDAAKYLETKYFSSVEQSMRPGLTKLLSLLAEAVGNIGSDIFKFRRERRSFQLAQDKRGSCSCNRMHHVRSLFMHATLVDGPAVVPLFCISIQLFFWRVVSHVMTG